MSVLDRIVIHGDCVEQMSMMGESSVDVIVADPPYGTTSLRWDKEVDPAWLVESARLTKSLWCFGPMSFWIQNGDLFTDAGWKYAQEVVWEKHNGSIFHADRFRRVHEFVVHWYRGMWRDIYRNPQKTMNVTKRTVRRKERPPHTGAIANSTYVSQDGGPRLMRSVLQIRSEHGRAEHPTQKPVDLIRPLVAYSCSPRGLVLDPFAGSGTTGIAAIQEGFRFVGIEREAEYVEIARKRIEHVAAELAAKVA